MVSVLDSGAEKPGFKSQPRHCRVTVLGKLFTLIVNGESVFVNVFLFTQVKWLLAKSDR